MEQLTLRAYTENSIIVEGNTKTYSQYLKKLGGKWNSNLTDPLTQQKIGAWIFSNQKYDTIKEFIDRVNLGEDPDAVFRSINRQQTVTFKVDVPIINKSASIVIGLETYVVTITHVSYSPTKFIHQAFIQWSNGQQNLIELKYNPESGTLEWHLKGFDKPHTISFS